MDVHHKTYKRVMRERPEDLQALCRPCHEIEDVRRRREKDPPGKLVEFGEVLSEVFALVVERVELTLARQRA